MKPFEFLYGRREKECSRIYAVSLDAFERAVVGPAASSPSRAALSVRVCACEAEISPGLTSNAVAHAKRVVVIEDMMSYLTSR